MTILRSSARLSSAAIGLAALLAFPGIASGAGGGVTDGEGAPDLPPQEVRIVGPDGVPAPAPEETMSEVERYCVNIADKAQDARHAMQQQELLALEKEIEVRIGELEAQRAEYQGWLAERQAFLDGAGGVLTEIYAQMSAEAAAEQLAQLEPEAAASVLVKLKSRQASDIMSEMPSETAAKLAGIIVEKTAVQKAASADPAPENQS